MATFFSHFDDILNDSDQTLPLKKPTYLERKKSKSSFFPDTEDEESIDNDSRNMNVSSGKENLQRSSSSSFSDILNDGNSWKFNQEKRTKDNPLQGISKTTNRTEMKTKSEIREIRSAFQSKTASIAPLRKPPLNNDGCYFGDIQFPSVRSILWDRRPILPPILVYPEHILPNVIIPMASLKYASQSFNECHSNGENDITLCGYFEGDVVSGNLQEKNSCRIQISKFHSIETSCDSNIACRIPFFLSNTPNLYMPKEHLQKIISSYQLSCHEGKKVDLSTSIPIRAIGRQLAEGVLSIRLWVTIPTIRVTFTPIRQLPILLTPLANNLLNKAAANSLNTGFLTLHNTRKAVPLLESDPLSLTSPLIGIWVSGLTQVYNDQGNIVPLYHPYLWSCCIRYLHTSTIEERVALAKNTFLVMLFPRKGGGKVQCLECFANSEGAKDISLAFAQYEFISDIYMKDDIYDTEMITCRFRPQVDGYRDLNQQNTGSIRSGKCDNELKQVLTQTHYIDEDTPLPVVLKSTPASYPFTTSRIRQKNGDEIEDRDSISVNLDSRDVWNATRFGTMNEVSKVKSDPQEMKFEKKEGSDRVSEKSGKVSKGSNMPSEKPDKVSKGSDMLSKGSDRVSDAKDKDSMKTTPMMDEKKDNQLVNVQNIGKDIGKEEEKGFEGEAILENQTGMQPNAIDVNKFAKGSESVVEQNAIEQKDIAIKKSAEKKELSAIVSVEEGNRLVSKINTGVSRTQEMGEGLMESENVEEHDLEEHRKDKDDFIRNQKSLCIDEKENKQDILVSSNLPMEVPSNLPMEVPSNLPMEEGKVEPQVSTNQSSSQRTMPSLGLRWEEQRDSKEVVYSTTVTPFAYQEVLAIQQEQLMIMQNQILELQAVLKGDIYHRENGRKLKSVATNTSFVDNNLSTNCALSNQTRRSSTPSRSVRETRKSIVDMKMTIPSKEDGKIINEDGKINDIENDECDYEADIGSFITYFSSATLDIDIPRVKYDPLDSEESDTEDEMEIQEIERRYLKGDYEDDYEDDDNQDSSCF